MSRAVSLVFPHQLFEKNPCLSSSRPVVIFEDPLYFKQFEFHKKKIILHRASMKYYESFLKKKGYPVDYYQQNDCKDLESLFNILKQRGIEEVHYCDTTDYLLDRRLERFSSRLNIRLHACSSPQFLNDGASLTSYFEENDNYFLHHFYMRERKRLNILMEDKKPVGGKWSFDEENRKKIPKGLPLPKYTFPKQNAYVAEAIDYTTKYFNHHIGTIDDFHFPVTHDDARRWLEHFIVQRFSQFGPYEDAILSNEAYLFHSILTPALNTGLLTPHEIIEKVLAYGTEEKIPLASIEGFIRQVIGWREFIRGVYAYRGVYQRKRNFWNHTRPLPESFYSGTTGIVPVDKVILQLHDTAYSHHIERLMVMGNFMLLCEIDPDEVYKWFMEFYIDAYDWVMVPNVYGMSQFADGGLMSTKPYISGSNYVLKMSDYKKGEWSETWNSLYWRFIYLHRDFFQQNQRTMMITKTLERMDKAVLKKHVSVADKFIEKL